jgi:hypothetical protein
MPNLAMRFFQQCDRLNRIQLKNFLSVFHWDILLYACLYF